MRTRAAEDGPELSRLGRATGRSGRGRALRSLSSGVRGLSGPGRSEESGAEMVAPSFLQPLPQATVGAHGPSLIGHPPPLLQRLLSAI